jgi:glycosyltransferase involved in cell wall biosynthesis
MVEPVNPPAEQSGPWFMTKILRRDPLVTFSSAGLREFPILSLPSALPELFDVPRGLHLLHFTHTVEAWQAPDNVAASYARAKAALPGHEFLALTASETESWLLAQRGVPSLLGSGLIFTDERVWKPVPPIMPGLRIYDAVYSARLAPTKRHELASAVKSLMLVYPHSLTGSEEVAYRRVKEILPQAFFANHEAGHGRYLKFDAENMVKLLAHAQVGLCLTQVEGCMRASIEYMLAGLPVVSTKSTGGRDRYFFGPQCRIVPDDPDRIAAAVIELRDANLDRRRVRGHVAQLLAFDRFNFLSQLNRISERCFNKADLFDSFEPFIGTIAQYRPLHEVVEQLRASLGGNAGGRTAVDSVH